MPFCFVILFMTFAMNIKTNYRIPVILNNKNTVTENNKKNSYREHYKQYRSHGTIQTYQLQGKTRKQGTIEEILIRRNNTKIQLTVNNTRNTNYNEQYRNKA